MDNTLAMIAVFRTNVTNQRNARRLKPLLEQIQPRIAWNFDLEDRERILRVECLREQVAQIEQVVRREGFLCQELE